MSMGNQYDYSQEDIVSALSKVGITSGDSILIHCNLGFFGRLKNAATEQDYYRIYKEAIFELIGSSGTLITPTFSYSFCNGTVYDKDTTPGVCGFFSEMIRKDPQSLRSNDPNFSVAAIGKNAEYFTKGAPQHSFGRNSIGERFVEYNGKICNFNFNSASLVVHYTEKLLNVPYRHDKAFHGKRMEDGILKESICYHFVRDLDKPDDFPDFTKFDKKAKEQGYTKTANLGRGQIVSISAKDTVELITIGLKSDPSFLTKGCLTES